MLHIHIDYTTGAEHEQNRMPQLWVKFTEKTFQLCFRRCGTLTTCSYSMLKCLALLIAMFRNASPARLYHFMFDKAPCYSVPMRLQWLSLTHIRNIFWLFMYVERDCLHYSPLFLSFSSFHIKLQNLCLSLKCEFIPTPHLMPRCCIKAEADELFVWGLARQLPSKECLPTSTR